MVKSIEELVLDKNDARDYLLRFAPDLVGIYDDILDCNSTTKLAIAIDDDVKDSNVLSNKDLLTILEIIENMKCDTKPKLMC